MNIVWKVLIAIVAIIIINRFVQGLLITVVPPIGLICVVVLYLGVLAWLLGFIGR